MLLKFICLKKSVSFCEWVIFWQTPGRELLWCFFWMRNTFSHKPEGVTCTVDGWMLWACLCISSFFHMKSHVWDVGDSVCNYYTHAYVLTRAGKLACCYICAHRIALKLPSFIVPGGVVAEADACKPKVQFFELLLTYFETSAGHVTAVHRSPGCHKRWIASILLAHCGISSSHACALLCDFPAEGGRTVSSNCQFTCAAQEARPSWDHNSFPKMAIYLLTEIQWYIYWWPGVFARGLS